MESRSLIDYSVFVILDTYVENSNSTAVKMCNDDFFAFGFLQNEYLRPKTQNENCFFFTSLSNQRQSNRVTAFPQTPNDAKSMGSSFFR